MNKIKRIEKRKEKIKIKKAKIKELTRQKINNIENRILNRSTKEKLKQKAKESRKTEIVKLNYDFSGYKKSLNNNSFFNGLQYERRTKNANGYNDFYKIKNRDNVDDLLQKVFRSGKATGVLIILEIERNDIRSFYSRYFTSEGFENLEEQTAIENVLEGIGLKQQYEGYKLINIHIRIIYENLKTLKK